MPLRVVIFSARRPASRTAVIGVNSDGLQLSFHRACRRLFDIDLNSAARGEEMKRETSRSNPTSHPADSLPTTR